jgi:tetratricopeptide (TPR) repeat protein
MVFGQIKIYDRCMKKQFLIITVLISSILSEVGWAFENPSVRSPVISGTVPPSRISSGLIPTPNPIDDSGNLVITGNVTGGKHFRGQIPYSSTTNFRAPLGSSSLDSFLRYSADLADFERYRPATADTSYPSIGRYRPFFSPSATVATTKIGQPYVLAQDKGLYGVKQDLVRPAKGTSQGQGGLLNIYPDYSSSAWSVLSRSPQELEKIISNELGREPLRFGNLRHIRGETAISERKYSATQSVDDSVPPFFSTEPSSDSKQDIIASPQIVPSGPSQLPGVFPSNAAELDRLISQVENREKTRPRLKGKQSNVYEQVQNRLDDLVRPKSLDRITKTQDSDQLTTMQQDESVAIQADAGRHKNLDSFTTGRFEWYMQAAEMYLKQGRFYRAADSYSMASVYKPGEASAYIGKSHALFAAGEYMTSALFLSRAIEAAPEYTRLKVDLVELLGNQDKFNKRVADVEQHLKISGTAELQFLLGYVYYQSFLRDGVVEDEWDRLDAAKRLLDAAHQNLPGSKAIGTLSKAVNQAMDR